MSIRIINLGSSSQGNCTLYQSGETKILVDAGLTGRQIELRLYEVGIDPKSVDFILLTHEHNDHCQGAESFRKKFPKVKILANYATLKAITGSCAVDEEVFKVFRSGAHFKLGEVIVGSFRVPHSAAEAVGFELYLGDISDAIKVVHATDLGHVDEDLDIRMAGADVILLESNYDPQMLAEKETLRPFETHKRNQGRTGHLANQETGQALLRAKNLYVNGDGGRWNPAIGLLHLSRTFNTPDLALGTVRSICQAERLCVTREDRPTVVYES